MRRAARRRVRRWSRADCTASAGRRAGTQQVGERVVWKLDAVLALARVAARLHLAGIEDLVAALGERYRLQLRDECFHARVELRERLERLDVERGEEVSRAAAQVRFIG